MMVFDSTKDKAAQAWIASARAAGAQVLHLRDSKPSA
jgi:hypothetical protein